MKNFSLSFVNEEKENSVEIHLYVVDFWYCSSMYYSKETCSESCTCTKCPEDTSDHKNGKDNTTMVWIHL